MRALSCLDIRFDYLLMPAVALSNLIVIRRLPELLCQTSYAADVTFVAAGPKDPTLEQPFDPDLQMIEKGQAIAFVNPDAVANNPGIRSDADCNKVFNTDEMERIEFASHVFHDYGKDTPACNFLPIANKTVEFATIVILVFSGLIIVDIMASILGTNTLYVRKGLSKYHLL